MKMLSTPRRERYRMLRTAHPDLATALLKRTEDDAQRRWRFLKDVAARSFGSSEKGPSPS